MVFGELLKPLYETVIGIAGVYGLPGYFIAMILQSIIAPIPSEAVLLIGGATFGVLMGGIIGSLGETVGAIFGFYISRKGGRKVVRKFLGEKITEFTDNWFNSYGGRAVFIGRLVPVVPFDAVSYGAGLTGMSFKTFIIATAIASFPRAFFYAILGGFAASEIERAGFVTAFNKIFIILAGLAITLVAMQHILVRKFSKNSSKIRITGFFKKFFKNQSF